MLRNLQINKCRGNKVKVFMRNGNVLTGFLAFYNYDEQVIHIENYEMSNEKGVIEKGDFWVVNSKSWDNMAIPNVIGGMKNEKTIK